MPKTLTIIGMGACGVAAFAEAVTRLCYDPGDGWILHLIERLVEDLLHVEAIFPALGIFDAIGIEWSPGCRAPCLEPGPEVTRLAVIEPHETGFGVQAMPRLFRAERQTARKLVVPLDQMEDPSVARIIA